MNHRECIEVPKAGEYGKILKVRFTSGPRIGLMVTIPDLPFVIKHGTGNQVEVLLPGLDGPAEILPDNESVN